MVEMVRRVFCDCCGEEVTDMFGGYTVRSLGRDHRIYDICNDCNKEFGRLCNIYESDVIECMFNKEGRPNEA